MAELPEDLTMEIGLRLPVKSVGQFRSVSKRWNLILSSPEFLKPYEHESILLMDSSTRGFANPVPHVIADQVPSPIAAIEFDMDFKLAVMGGCLALVEGFSKLEEINVWIMEKPGSWTRFTIHSSDPERIVNCVICRLDLPLPDEDYLDNIHMIMRTRKEKD